MTQRDTPEAADGNNRIPSSITQVGIIMKYTLLDFVRSRRFYILLGIDLVISILLTAVVAHYRPQSFLSSEVSFFSSWWGIATVFVIVLSGIFFGGDAISGEFQNRTGYYTVPNPIRRSSIYIGKWLSAFIASTAILAVYAVIAVANEFYYFGASLPYQFGEALIFSWVYLAAVLGFTFFFSSLFKNSSMSILVTAILLLFGFEIIQTIVTALVKIEPWFLLSYGSQIIGNVLSETYPQHVVTGPAAPFGPGQNVISTSYFATIPEGLAIMGAYFAITAILGLLLFERKEFT